MIVVLAAGSRSGYKKRIIEACEAEDSLTLVVIDPDQKTATAFLDLARQYLPSIIILPLGWSFKNRIEHIGYEVAKLVHKEYSIIVLTETMSPPEVDELKEDGVTVIRTDSTGIKLLQAIKEAIPAKAET